MSKWENVKLSNIINIVSGGTPKTSIPEYWDGDIPWLTIKDFNGPERMVYKTEKLITELGVAKSATTVLKKGDLIISARGTIAELAQLGADMAFNQSCYGVTAKKCTSNEYLYYLLTYSKPLLINIANGATFGTIIRKTFDYIKVQLPDLETQQKIADVLSTYDKLIENNNRRIEILEKLAEEIYKEWFVRMRFPGYENSRFIKGIPEGWEVLTLGKVIRFINGYTFLSNDYLQEGQYKIITIKNVQDGNIDTLNTAFLNNIPKNMNTKVKLDIGDMLLSLTGNVGRIGLVAEKNLLLNQRVAKIEPLDKRYRGFVYFLFRSDNNKNKLIDISTGTAQQNLSPVKALKTKFIGNYNAIIQFSTIVEPMIESIISIKIQNQNLIKQRNLLLPRLMNGTIEVK